MQKPAFSGSHHQYSCSAAAAAGHRPCNHARDGRLLLFHCNSSLLLARAERLKGDREDKVFLCVRAENLRR